MLLHLSNVCPSLTLACHLVVLDITVTNSFRRAFQVWPGTVGAEAISHARVHTGFRKSWRANGLDKRVVACVRDVYGSGNTFTNGGNKMRITLTGAPDPLPNPLYAFWCLAISEIVSQGSRSMFYAYVSTENDENSYVLL
jgi:hypothetical protein